MAETPEDAHQVTVIHHDDRIIMKTLLDLPPELIEHILALLAHENAQSLAACRQTCRTLNATIAQSVLVLYLERAALLGVYDPLLIPEATTAVDSLPERTAALEGWDEAWRTLDETLHAGKPDRCFAMPLRHELIARGITAEVVTMTVVHDAGGSGSGGGGSGSGGTGGGRMTGPSPRMMMMMMEAAEAEAEDAHFHFSFGPWFLAAAREGYGVRAGYSYLDVHGSLCGGGGGGDGGDGRDGSGRDEEEEEGKGGDGGVSSSSPSRMPYRWTTINVPVRDVVVFALSTELDLAVAISARVEREEGGRHRLGVDENESVKSRLEVRPLRFRDGTRHPCAEVPTIRFSVAGASAHNMAQTQVIGDYLLLWIGGPSEEDYSLCKLYLIAWKQGSVTLLRDNPAGKYGSIATMISEDVFALVQLDPPGIELCRLSNMKEGGGSVATSGGGSSSGPRMDRLCTLLLPPLRDGARMDWAVCVGEHPGHQPFSHGPWPEYRRAPPRRQFRQSTRDSIVSIVMQITGNERQVRIFDVVVRCATLLAHAAAAAATVKSPSSSPNGQQEGSATEADADADGSNDDGGVPWAEWGPRVTSMSDHTSFEWNDLLGERRATIDQSGHRIRIYDFNPYRIRQARRRTSELAKCCRGEGGCSDEEGGGDESQSHQNGTRRITESSTIRGGEWFQDDVSTALPHLDILVYMPGCMAIYMEQDQLLLHVDEMDDYTRSPNRTHREGFLLYRM